MKKHILLLFLLLGVAWSALAVPAMPGKYRRVQPDGSVIVLENHGDEYCHWITDEKGRVVEKGPDGFYHLVESATHKARLRRATANRPRVKWSTYETAPETNFGDRKVLCILANFTDSVFVIENPRQSFSNLLNQEGYSANGSVGSVRDYYLDNSMGQFRPQFDVYGPVNLSQSSNYYDKNGAHLAIMEAYDLLADQIPIDDYDSDGDGNIDMILFYYPGHNQAEQAGEESIWPHQGTGDFGYLGSKHFVRYFCTSELRNASGKDMCNIGTTCHEFAHSLGLPDFYDTDYEANGFNNDNSTYFDLMAGGNYLLNGAFPPYLLALERNMLGWMPNPEILPEGETVLQPIRENVAYKIPALKDGEYFLLECRDDYKWDYGIWWHFKEPGGLVVYRVDQSDRMIVGAGQTAAQLWSTNKVNAYGGEPCFWTVPSALENETFMFPGKQDVTRVFLSDKDGNGVGASLNSIAFDGTRVQFNCVYSTDRVVYGTVRNTTGTPMEGARIYLAGAVHPFDRRMVGREEDTWVTSDAKGCYELQLPDNDCSDFVVSVYMEGYSPISVNLPVEGQYTRNDVMLFRMDEGEHGNLQIYDPSKTWLNTAFGQPTIALAMIFDADGLKARGMAGGHLESVSFTANPTTWEKAYVIVAIDDQEPDVIDISDCYVPGPFTYDISQRNILLNVESQVAIGYGFTGLATSGEFPIGGMGPHSEFMGGGYISINFLTPPINWKKSFTGPADDPRYYNYVISAQVSHIRTPDFSDLGAAFIRIADDGVPEAVPAQDRTAYRTEWFLDGAPLEGNPPATASLPKGPHTYMARITYHDGSVERVYLDVE